MEGLQGGRLLERDDELAVLEEAVAATDKGRGRIVVVEGPAGIGKTRLLDAARAGAAQRGLTLLTCRCDPTDRELRYGAVRALLASVLNTADDPAAMLEGPAEVCVGLLSGAVRGPDEGTLFYALDWFVSDLVDDEPVAIVVDDAQWADPASQRWLARLSGRVAELGILLVVGSRVGGRIAEPTEVAKIAARPEARLLLPAPLSPGAVARLLRDELGREPDTRFAAACHDAIGGNPFYATELAKAVRAEGLAPTAANARQVSELRPDRIARSVLLRIAALGEPASDAARAVAVMGPAAELRHIAALVGATPDEAAMAVDALVAEGILAEGHPTGYLHPLLRDIVWDSIPRRRRAAAHARAAELLADDGATETRVASHLLESDPLGLSWVVEALLAAARREHGSETAIHYLQRALAEPPPPELEPIVMAELRLAPTGGDRFGRVIPLSRAARG